jgi:hypothetical protein
VTAIAAMMTVVCLARLAGAQTQCETPTPQGIAQCLESRRFRTNLDYRFNTRLLVALGVDYYHSQPWIDATAAYIAAKTNLTGKTGARLGEDSHYRTLFNLALGTAWSVQKPMDIYLLMGQSNMTLHGDGPVLKAALQSWTDALTQALGWPSRQVVTFNCSLPGSPILLWDPQPSPLYGRSTCETSSTVTRCLHPPTGCTTPKLCSCDSGLLDFCSDGVSFIDAQRGGGGYSPYLNGDVLDRYNLTRQCLETATTMRNAAGQTGAIRGMFWYQGESDTGNSATVSTWAQSYENVVQFVRTTVGGNIPAVHAQIRGDANSTPLWQQLQVEQRLVAQDITNSAFVCTNDFNTVDGVHIDSAAHQVLGQRFGDAMLHLILGYPYNATVPGCTPR